MSSLEAHDCFLIINNRNVYHIGASLKDLGRKMFAFSRHYPIPIGSGAVPYGRTGGIDKGRSPIAD